MCFRAEIFRSRSKLLVFLSWLTLAGCTKDKVQQASPPAPQLSPHLKQLHFKLFCEVPATATLTGLFSIHNYFHPDPIVFYEYKKKGNRIDTAFTLILGKDTAFLFQSMFSQISNSDVFAFTINGDTLTNKIYYNNITFYPRDF